MTSVRLALGATLLLALAGPAASQTTEIQKKLDEALSQERKKKMHEDMAVFRLLVRRTVARAYGLSEATPHGGTGRYTGSLGPGGSGDGGIGPFGFGGNDPHHNFPLVESVYLPKQGVVVTLSAPPAEAPDRKADTAAPPASDWDEARRELRGEKSRADRKKAAARPSVSDAVLRLLAENGKHFGALPEGESVTVALTFRDGMECRKCHVVGTGMTSGRSEGGMSPYAPMGSGAGPVGAGSPFPVEGGGIGGLPGEGGAGSPSVGRTFPPTGGSPLKPGDDGGDAKSLLLLAELHMKQKKFKEAVEEFEKALKVEVAGLDRATDRPSQEDLKRLMGGVEISSKLAAALLADGKIEQAQAMMANARKLSDAAALLAEKLRGKTGTTAAPSGLRVPSQLIVSAPKRLLDQVGQGTISFDEFRKQATVEYSHFPADEKKDPMK